MSNDLIKVIAILTEALTSAHAEIETLKVATKNVAVNEPAVNTAPVEISPTELRDQLSQAFEANGLITELAAVYDQEQARASAKEVARLEAEAIHNLAQERLAKGKAQFKKPNSVKLVKKSKTTR